MIKVKRVYEPGEKRDGFRILVDRLWPRGLTKQRARVDLWLKEVAPSDELRRWYSHEAKKWPTFKRRYRSELKGRSALLRRIKEMEKQHGTVTLLFSSREVRLNNAFVLMEILRGR